MSIKVNVLKAYDGDCFIINLENKKQKYNILIDGGDYDTYEDILKVKLLNIFMNKDENIDLLVITHIDDDHIGGIKALFEDSSIDKSVLKKKIKKVWFNSAEVIANSVKFKIEEDIKKREVKIFKNDVIKISKSNANSLEREFKELGIELEVIKKAKVCKKIDDMCFTILSPTYEKLEKLHKEWPVPNLSISSYSSDYKKNIEETILTDNLRCNDSNNANGASIAFILEFMDKKLLMLGDAYEDVLRQSLVDLGYSKENKLKVDLVKVSHHASNGNASKELIEMIECEKYIISSDGSIKNLPGKRCLSRIIKYSILRPIFYFNYDIVEEIFGPSYKCEEEKYKFKCNIMNDPLEV